MRKKQLRWKDLVVKNIVINFYNKKEIEKFIRGYFNESGLTECRNIDEQVDEQVDEWIDRWEKYEKKIYLYLSKYGIRFTESELCRGWAEYDFRDIEFISNSELTIDEKEDNIVAYCCSDECNKCLLLKNNLPCIAREEIYNDYDYINKAYELVLNSIKQQKDNVNHPTHYNNGKVECIEAMVSAYGAEAVKHFCICNAFKYIWRTEQKNGIEDIDKAIWYLTKYKELK